MSDPQQILHASLRQVTDDLAHAYAKARADNPDLAEDAFFDALRRQVVAKAQTLARVDALGPMGGGGEDEA